MYGRVTVIDNPLDQLRYYQRPYPISFEQIFSHLPTSTPLGECECVCKNRHIHSLVLDRDKQPIFIIVLSLVAIASEFIILRLHMDVIHCGKINNKPSSQKDPRMSVWDYPGFAIAGIDHSMICACSQQVHDMMINEKLLRTLTVMCIAAQLMRAPYIAIDD